MRGQGIAREPGPVHGEYPESGGLKNTCIPMPFDAGGAACSEDSACHPTAPICGAAGCRSCEADAECLARDVAKPSRTVAR